MIPPLLEDPGAVATAAGLSLLFVALAFLALRRGQAHGWVDVAWVAGTLASGLVFILAGDGPTLRASIASGLLVLWAARLGLHLARRAWKSPHDPRYERLEEVFGARISWALPVWYLVQAVLALVLGLAAAAAASRPGPLDLRDLLGVVVALAGLLVEARADRELARHRADPERREEVLDSGLWAWSRHPNYFGEWLYWCSFPLLGAGVGPEAVSLLAPLIMTLFLFRLTGIPHAEKQALARRGARYAAYQERTSVFFPWPPKRNS